MRYFLIIIFLGVCLGAIAEEEKNFFGLSRVDFFGKKQKKEAKKTVPESENPQNTTLNNTNSALIPKEDDWTEPIIDGTGKVTLHTPPKVVRDFVENPSEENAEVYLEWNMDRLNKLEQTQKELKEIALLLFRREQIKQQTVTINEDYSSRILALAASSDLLLAYVSPTLYNLKRQYDIEMLFQYCYDTSSP